MARPVGELTLEALAERVEALEAGTSARVVPNYTSAPAVERAPQADPGSQPAAPARATGAAEPAPAAPATSEAPPAAAAPAPEPPAAAPAAVPGPAIPSSGLDRASARRAWPAVLAEIRRIKPTRAEMYGRIEADVDADGQTLVLEFPADQEFAMQMAEEPDMRELLQRALGAAIGFAPPVRFRLGKSLATAPAPTPDLPTATRSRSRRRRGSRLRRDRGRFG